MDGGGDGLRRRIRKESAAFLEKAVVGPDYGVRRRGAQTNNQARLHDGEFRREPGLAGGHLGR